MTRSADPAAGLGPRIAWWAYALAWLPALVLTAVNIGLRPGAGLQGAVVGALSSVGTTALLGLGVWWLTARITWPERGSRVGFFAVHLALALSFGGTVMGTQLGLLAADVGMSAALTYIPRDTIGWMVLSGMYIYGMIGGTSYALRLERRVHEQRLTAARAESLAARAQLDALRARLQPHFLFNAIHSLSALAREDPAAVEIALEQLGELLRYALDRGDREMVRLEDEWAFTKNYLELEQLRFGPRLAVEAQLAEDALACRVPSLILQPIVENAVRHGLASRSRGGTVRVEARRTSGALELVVRDDGAGAAPEAVSAAPGLGLSTVRQRLTALYDGRAGMAIATAPGAGFTVRITLPAESA